ncbi:MAG: hypothetical protein J7623_07315 [Chitinophaga sp.]|uniref:hypothetical protein n=1 Tax=Chitinophaga sp. TaxID=1869181 RepID=UPI001B238A3D|nr:hypothetical protein [Chitinophaga sp.]MBO9728433.1 hypothetical protein [Chitinophaga sp.]
MRNPTRRNRNIGTASQGFGQNNRLEIPGPLMDHRSFFERLGPYEKTTYVINGHTFVFIVEATSPHYRHACSIADVIRMIAYVPVEHYGSLRFIVFRQPKRKENILSPCWGRLIYSYEFEHDYYPAIILEAFDERQQIKWKRTLTLEDQKELERLKADGHPFREDKRSFTAPLSAANVRNTQLYRTFLHEFGHYVHYQEMVERVARDDEDYDKYWNIYKKLPSVTKETFAHQYADRLKAALQQQQLIPLAPVVPENHSS